MGEYKPAADIEVRRTMIGASDGAAILGISTWRTPVEVWREKTGETQGKDLSHVEAVEVGTLLEDDVIEMYARRTGYHVTPCTETFRMDPPYEFIGAHPDAIVRQDPGDDHLWLCEAKTSGITSVMRKEKRDEWGLEGSDEIPLIYLVQCQHQMMVTGTDKVDVAALIGGRGYIQHRVYRDETWLRDTYLPRLRDFWLKVLDGVPPEAKTEEDIRLLYPADDGRELCVSPDGDIADDLRTIARCKMEKDKLAEFEEAARMRVKNAMEGSQRITIDGKVWATWKSSTRKTINTKAIQVEHPEIASQYTEEKDTRTFLVKYKEVQ